MAVHMFIFYWGMLSAITPPVAIAFAAAAGIAGAPAMKTGWESMWVGSIIYFIPFFFVLNPALLLQGIIRISKRSGLRAGLFRHRVHLRRRPGLSGYVGDLRGAGFMEWPLRVLLVIGGFADRHARRRHHAALAMADHLARIGDPDPDRADRAGADTPPDPGAEPVARTLIALHKRRR